MAVFLNRPTWRTEQLLDRVTAHLGKPELTILAKGLLSIYPESIVLLSVALGAMRVARPARGRLYGVILYANHLRKSWLLKSNPVLLFHKINAHF